MNPRIQENERNPDIRDFRLTVGHILAGLGAIAAIVILWSTFYVVDAGERAVVFNSVTGLDPEPKDEGLHFKVPFVERVTTYEVRSQIDKAVAEGASMDLQDVKTEVAVLYHPEPGLVVDLHQQVGPSYRERVIRPAIQEAIKGVTAKHLAVDLIVNRSIVKDEIQQAITDRLLEVDITVDEVSITDFDFSPEFNAAIEAKVTAEQNALTEKNKLVAVEFQAQQRIAEAMGQAEAARIIGQEIASDPAYMLYLWLQRWNGVMPQYLAGNGTESPGIFIPAMPQGG